MENADLLLLINQTKHAKRSTAIESVHTFGRGCCFQTVLDYCCYHPFGSLLDGIHTFLWDNAEV